MLSVRRIIETVHLLLEGEVVDPLPADAPQFVKDYHAL